MKAAWIPLIMCFLSLSLTGAVVATPLHPSLNRERLKDQDGQSLAEKIRLASRAYLKLDGLEAERLIKESIDLIQKNPPYVGLRADLAQLASLNVVLKEEQPATTMLIDPFPFRMDEAFQKNLSDRMRDYWINQSRGLIEVAELNEFSSIRISGDAIHLPAKLAEGDYLVHMTKDGKHWGGWIHVSNKTGIQFEKSFEIPPQLIARESTPKIADQESERSKAQQLNQWLQAEASRQIPLNPMDPTVLDLKSNSTWESNQALYQKPWFWIAVGLVSGLGGFATYQALRSPTVVQLP
jgi:hypothetical protein